jgi:hypothetical protein
MKRTLSDSSEIKEAAALFNEILGKPGKSPVPSAGAPGREKEPGPVYRGDRLEGALISMCQRGDFRGAVLTDNHGLPLAVHNSPVNDETLAAFTSVLGESLVKTAHFLNQPNANNLSMDINDLDKIILRKFFVDDEPYFLMIISPQHVDERSEIELSTIEIADILSEG